MKSQNILGKQQKMVKMPLSYTMTEFCNFNFTQGYRTPPEELGPHHMMHPHQASQFQGIPQLPQ